MKRTLLVLSFLLAASRLWAAAPGRDKEEDYVTRPERPFSVRLGTDYSWSRILTEGSSGISSDFTSQHRAKTGLSIAFRDFGISFNVGVKDKVKDNYSFSLHNYGTRFHFKLDILRDNSYAGTVRSGEQTFDFMPGYIQHRSINGDIWYCFNGKKFSFPAAFTQSRIQKRSAGSFILAAAYKNTTTHMEADAALGLPITDITGYAIGLGGGYGFNLVLGNLLLHASAISTLVLYSHNVVTIDGHASRLQPGFPNNISTGNLAAVVNFTHFFTGVTFSCSACNIGTPDPLKADFLRISTQLILGVRF